MQRMPSARGLPGHAASMCRLTCALVGWGATARLSSAPAPRVEEEREEERGSEGDLMRRWTRRSAGGVALLPALLLGPAATGERGACMPGS
jgi:hypothetical protein